MPRSNNNTSLDLINAALSLRQRVDKFKFSDPVTHVYNPLDYAWASYEEYLKRFARKRQIILLGMNPGPWGMAQTGIPFGVIWAVRDWMKIDTEIKKPENEHPKRPVLGLKCHRNEVSGDRLWGWARERFNTPENFFSQFFIANYCPLSFMEESGRNRVPEKLPKGERELLISACDDHLNALLKIMQPKMAIGVGKFAEDRLNAILNDSPDAPTVGRIPHPSPASPAANKNWAGAAEEALKAMGIEIGLSRI